MTTFLAKPTKEPSPALRLVDENGVHVGKVVGIEIGPVTRTDVTIAGRASFYVTVEGREIMARRLGLVDGGG